MSDVNIADPTAETSTQPKKRTRVQFSCTACRYRKLKCCRTYPCTNCKKRGEAATCTFVGRGPRGKGQHERASPTLVQDRLQHLENLVMSLANQPQQNQLTDFNTGRPENVSGYETPASAEEKPSPQDTGTLVVNDEGTSYIDSANWRAILEEINGVKEYLEHEERSDDEDDPYQENSPVLLLGLTKTISKEEVLVDIPPRTTTDRLISRFLKTTEPSLVVIHLPVFQREYEQFWQNPPGMSFTWIALLYSIMTLSVSVYHRSEEPLPLNMTHTMELWDIFRRRAAECLVQANYLSPGRYKCETLFLYGLCEFYRSQDAQIGVSYLMGIGIRLAMRMGYHRDARHYPRLPAWEGEMRRRVWALMTQIDTLTSFQVGLPRQIQPWQYDTEPPSNLLDTDFDEDTVHLPPARPAEQRTPCSYTVAKHRIMMIFGQISDLAFSRESVSYDEILEIDKHLEQAHNKFPSFFQHRPMAQCIADPSDLILRRYTLELLYQKSRIVLHRRYMGETHSKFAYSRSVCLSAARKTLQHHADIWSESLRGGQLYAERFFLNSLQNTDFMLSAMILCLELSRENGDPASSRLGRKERLELIEILEATHRAFKEMRRKSVDTQRAFAALTIMLSRVKGESVESLTAEPERRQDTDMVNDTLMFPPTSASNAMDHQYTGLTPGNDVPPGMYDLSDTSYSSLGVIEDMLRAPDQLDWRLYDSRVSGFEAGNQDTLWYSTGEVVPPPMDFGTFPPNA